MGASLIQPCRVSEEGLRVVKLFQVERNRTFNIEAWMTNHQKKHRLTTMPAARGKPRRCER